MNNKPIENQLYHVKNGLCAGASDDRIEKGDYDQVNLTWLEIQSYLPHNATPTVSECRIEKLAEMRKECGNHIDAGFESDVLGYPCQYNNSSDQQTTMRNAAINGGKIWRNEAFTLHTKEQAQSVFDESLLEIEMHRTTYADKCIYINDPSRTANEILAVTWDSAES